MTESKHLKLCQSPTESGVIIAWDVNSVDAGPSPFAGSGPPIKTIGTNPYTWQSGGDSQPVSGIANLGILSLRAGFGPEGQVPGSGNGVGPMGSFPLNALPMGLEVTGLGKPASPEEAFGMAPGGFTVQVNSETGSLMIPDPQHHGPTLQDWYKFFGEPFVGGSYHVCDYTYFWANIRHNVAVRVGAFVAAGGARL